MQAVIALKKKKKNSNSKNKCVTLPTTFGCVAERWEAPWASWHWRMAQVPSAEPLGEQGRVLEEPTCLDTLSLITLPLQTSSLLLHRLVKGPQTSAFLCFPAPRWKSSSCRKCKAKFKAFSIQRKCV